MPDREAFIEKLEAQMREWSARLEDLMVRVRKVTSARRAEYAEQIAALQSRRDEAAEKIRELRGAGEHALEELREAAEKGVAGDGGWHWTEPFRVFARTPRRRPRRPRSAESCRATWRAAAPRIP